MTDKRKKRQKTGLYALKTLVSLRGLDGIDQRTLAGKALVKWKSDLLQDLGGEVNLSTQKRALVDAAVRSKLFLDSLDAWLVTQPSLVNGRKKSILPALGQRQTLLDGLLRIFEKLGLDRREIDAGRLPEAWIEKVRPRNEQEEAASDEQQG